MKLRLFGKQRIEIEHRGAKVEGQPMFYSAMLFEPKNSQPHLRIPEKTIFRCMVSEDAIEFLNETTNATQPMMQTWEGNMRRLGITPMLILMSPDEDAFRSLLNAFEDDLREREYIIEPCPSSWGYGWSR